MVTGGDYPSPCGGVCGCGCGCADAFGDNEGLRAYLILKSFCMQGVPFVDVLTTILDETIPLTIIEW